MNYDRRAALPRLHEVLAKPAQADEALGQAYLALVSFKLGFDSMEEIPKHLLPLYQATMKAMDAVGTARHETTQVREQTRRLAR